MSRLRNGGDAALGREQWQLLVEVLDGDYDERKLEAAQDVLTLAAPWGWLQEAEMVDEVLREAEVARDSGGAGS